MSNGLRVFVVIPALNEENSISKVIQDVPRNIEGVLEVKVIVIDDGSTDSTAKVAEQAGADKVISFKRNRGLARAFQRGLDAALEMGADVIVNIDADGQYNSGEIPKLIRPILDGQADVVLTDRRIWSLTHMPLIKKVGNTIATWVTRLASEYPVLDGQSGFRARSREAALRINVFSDYTYVAETIIQANHKKLKIVQIPCTFNARKGKSKLIKNIFNYAIKSGLIILRTYLTYKPFETFVMLGGAISTLGVLTGLRVLLYYLDTGHVSPHIPTAILTTILLVIGFQVMVLGLIADLIHQNRKMSEEILFLSKKSRDGL